MTSISQPWVPFTADDISIEYHQLLDTFLPLGESDKGPTIRAAGEKDTSTLIAILQRAQRLSDKDRSEFVLDFVYAEDMAEETWDTPLLRAIACENAENIDLLLQHGANPNGADRESQASYSRRFRRFKSDDVYPDDLIVQIGPDQVGDPASQLLPLTADELATRSNTVSCFWAFPEALPLDRSGNGNLLHSILMSARTSIDMVDRILQAGADTSAWTETQSFDLREEELLASSLLCVSTPLHAAIDPDSMQLLEGILARGFNPNARPLIVGSQALTPLQHAIAAGNLDMQKRLVSCPQVDATLVTPVLHVHALHFAIAQLRMDLVTNLGLSLSAVPPTALGHTLLHVACLSLDQSHVQLWGPKIRQSVHDIRTLDLHTAAPSALRYPVDLSQIERPADPVKEGPGDPSDGLEVYPEPLGLEKRVEGPVEDRLLPLPPTTDFDLQFEVIQELLTELGPAEILKLDHYENSALHYLASSRIVNDKAVKWLRQQEHGDEVWRTVRNRWGWTPSDLWKDNVTTIEPGEASLRELNSRGIPSRQGHFLLSISRSRR